jgi:hypothetical protein
MLKKTSAAIGLATVATAGALITSSPGYAREQSQRACPCNDGWAHLE